jgi:hypothetical protein
MTEREISGFPKYSVNELGEVFGPKGKLKPQVTHKGYLRVCLHNCGVKRYVPIHTLVLEAFVGPRPARHECRHRSGDKTDNRLGNLCWGTGSENYEDKRKHGTEQSGERHGCAKLTWQQVQEIRAARASGPPNTKALAEQYGVDRTVIQRIGKGLLWRALSKEQTT